MEQFKNGEAVPVLATWMGKNVDDMTREELLVAFRQLAEMYEHARLNEVERGRQTVAEFKRLAKGNQ